MKQNNLSRLYIEMPLMQGDQIRMGKEQSHYLANVMRTKVGNQVKLFNGRDGEWLGSIKSLDKHNIILEIVSQLKKQERVPDVWLIFAPLKNTKLPFLIEKATELGVSGFVPIVTSHSVVDKINKDKIKSWIKEAAEQSDRITIPEIEKLRSWKDFLKDWPEDRTIFLCNESEKSVKLMDALKKHKNSKPCAIMIGPEGGFSEDELEVLNSKPYIVSVQIGPRILRAETAALSALTCFQSVLGDWNTGPRS